MSDAATAARRELVKLAYGDCQRPNLACRSLSFKTERVSLAEALNMAEVIGGYNRFDPDSLRERLERFVDLDVSVEVGREGSPVLYIYARSEDVRKAIVKALSGYANELSDDFGTIRAWWD